LHGHLPGHLPGQVLPDHAPQNSRELFGSRVLTDAGPAGARAASADALIGPAAARARVLSTSDSNTCPAADAKITYYADSDCCADYYNTDANRDATTEPPAGSAAAQCYALGADFQVSQIIICTIIN
jgi:hypothetical protein